MKKLIFIFALGFLFLAAGCSGKGAYTETEKEKQDSADEARQEDGFEALMNAKKVDTGTVVKDSTAKGQ